MTTSQILPVIAAATATAIVDQWKRSGSKYKLVTDRGIAVFYKVGAGSYSFQFTDFNDPEASFFEMIKDVLPAEIKANWKDIVAAHVEPADEAEPEVEEEDVDVEEPEVDEAETVSKQEAADRLGFAHISSVNEYAQKGYLEAVKVETVRAKQITIESIEKFKKQRQQ